jgi:hypothetical protein
VAVSQLEKAADKKKDSAAKGDKNKAASNPKVEKEKLQKVTTAEKDGKKSKKKKTQTTAAKGDASKPSTSKFEGDKDTPQKAKKPAQQWLYDEEITLSTELQKDRVQDVFGPVLPASRADPYWEKLLRRLPFMEKYDKEHSVERLCEKVRRMRLRYEILLQRIKMDEATIWKNKNEETLWRIWHTIWGPMKATVDTMNDEDEEDDEEEDEEDEKHTKSSKAVTPVGALQKKETRKKLSDSSSDDEESNKEESPVKPVQLEATVPSKNLTPAPMQVDLNNPGKDVAQVEDHGVQIDGRATVAAASQLGQKLPLSMSNGDMQHEGLAFLQDLRSTCLKMVDEAKTQSLSISEKLLDEARVKTAQMVDDAKMKSLQIMEELRIVAERLGNISGQGGRLAGTNSGGWSDVTDGLFSGRSLFGFTGMNLGDDNNLHDQWRVQSEAEQSLLLQRLQLVQEQARIQQEGIRLKIGLQKQQAKGKSDM